MSNYIPSTYEDFLNHGDLTLDSLKQLLEADSSWADRVNSQQESSLFIVLKNRKCSSDIVKLLLQYTSNINCLNSRGETCLFTALLYKEDEAVFKALLENGAQVDIRNVDKQTPLCFAFFWGTPENIVKLLLESKCPPYACGIHGSLMHCAFNRPFPTFTEDFLDLLIAEGGDLKSVDRNGQSALCLALQSGAKDAQYIELLLRKGGCLNACKKHDSPMLCATYCRYGSYLRKDVVQLLLKNKAAMDKRSCGLTSLQLALLRTCYELKAIKLMVDHSSIDANDFHEIHGNLLHVAVKNPSCKPSVVQLLIDRGVRVNEENLDGQTPMEIALMKGLDCHVLKLFFVAGASIDLSRRHLNVTFIQYDLDRYKIEPCHQNLVRFRLLLKYFCLQNLDFHIQCLPLNYSQESQFVGYADECKKEVQRMELQNLFRYHTLRDFACRPYLPNLTSNFIATMKMNELNRLLRILSDNTFPIYFDIIVAKSGRLWMKAKLKEVSVYTININTAPSCAERCIVLDYHSALNVIQYLSDEDLMRLIIAFFVD